MEFGRYARAAGLTMKALGLSLALAFAVQPAAASAVRGAPAVALPTPGAGAPAADAPSPGPSLAPAATAPAIPVAQASPGTPPPATGAYVPMKPTPGKGMPVDGGVGIQKQYSELGEYGRWMHDAVLMPIITIISLFVLILLLWVMVRYNKRANPTASRTSHNTLIEVLWTLIPVLILVGIAIPSIDLLAKQYRPAPAKALTIKATGYQWYWTYTYPDNGGFEIVSNMLPEDEAVRRGEPGQLGADFRMVVPVGEPIRMQITAADVLHAFGVPSLWFKLDAVPGQINEKVMIVDEPGVYYGQCSELCGARHAYMPIAIEALPRDRFNAWVLSQAGGVIDGQKPAAAAPTAAAPGAAPAAVPALKAGAATPAPGAAASPSPAPAAAASPRPAA